MNSKQTTGSGRKSNKQQRQMIKRMALGHKSKIFKIAAYEWAWLTGLMKFS